MYENPILQFLDIFILLTLIKRNNNLTTFVGKSINKIDQIMTIIIFL